MNKRHDLLTIINYLLGLNHTSLLTLEKLMIQRWSLLTFMLVFIPYAQSMEDALTKKPRLEEATKLPARLMISSLKDACALRVINNLIDQPLLHSQLYQGLSEEIKDTIKHAFINHHRGNVSVCENILQGYPRIISLKWNPKKHLALSISESGRIILWDIRDLANIQQLHSKYDISKIFSMDWSPCGNYALSGSVDGSVKLWNFTDLTKINYKELPSHQGPVTVVAWSPDGSSALTACDRDSMWLFNYQDAQETNDTTIKLWNMESFDAITSINLNGHSKGITQLLWSPDSRFFASSSVDKTVILWDCTDQLDTSFKILVQGTSQKKPALCWSPDGKFIATSKKAALIIWDLQKPDAPKPTELAGHQLPIGTIVWSPDGRYIISSAHSRHEKEDKPVRLWDLKNPHREPRVLSHDKVGEALTWSSDGSFILSTGNHNTLNILNSTDLTQEPALLSSPTAWIKAIPVSHDNMFALSYTGYIQQEEIMLWNLNPVAGLTIPQLILVGKLIKAKKTGTLEDLLKNDPLASEILKGLPKALVQRVIHDKTVVPSCFRVDSFCAVHGLGSVYVETAIRRRIQIVQEPHDFGINGCQCTPLTS